MPNLTCHTTATTNPAIAATASTALPTPLVGAALTVCICGPLLVLQIDCPPLSNLHPTAVVLTILHDVLPSFTLQALTGVVLVPVMWTHEPSFVLPFEVVAEVHDQDPTPALFRPLVGPLGGQGAFGEQVG